MAEWVRDDVEMRREAPLRVELDLVDEVAAAIALRRDMLNARQSHGTRLHLDKAQDLVDIRLRGAFEGRAIGVARKAQAIAAIATFSLQPRNAKGKAASAHFEKHCPFFGIVRRGDILPARGRRREAANPQTPAATTTASRAGSRLEIDYRDRSGLWRPRGKCRG